MKILGIYGQCASDHDPSSVLIVDGEIIAACEEERLVRKKHAVGEFPSQSIAFCLKKARLTPKDIDIIAIPWSEKEDKKYILSFFKRSFFYNPSRTFKTLLKYDKFCNTFTKNYLEGLEKAGFNLNKVKIEWFHHHKAHASSAYYPSGFKEAAIMTLDGAGGFLSGTFSRASNGEIFLLGYNLWPDSVGAFYSAFTELLGFDANDGEYKLMGMASYGKIGKIDLGAIIKFSKGSYKIKDGYYLGNPRRKRYMPDSDISKELVDKYGPVRKGDELDKYYANVAASVQEKLEETVMYLLENRLKEELSRHGNLCFAGGCALNVTLNRKLTEHPLVKNLWVQPASSDAGLSLGAAYLSAFNNGDKKIKKMVHCYYGPEYTNDEIRETLERNSLNFRKSDNFIEETAQLLKEGNIVGWFQGRMEWGPRALGARSILANPSISGMKDKVNSIIKFRESWRPFCPSLLEEFAEDILQNIYEASFMTFSVVINPDWRERLCEVIHIDGTARPQIVHKKNNLIYYKLIKEFYKKTGIPCVMNTSLNRRGEPIVCSPQDSINMFLGCGMKYMVLGEYIVEKRSYCAM